MWAYDVVGDGDVRECAAAMALRGVDRELTAVAEGGAQRVVWPANDAQMMLTGPAEIICTGRRFGAWHFEAAGIEGRGAAGGGFAGERGEGGAGGARGCERLRAAWV